MVEPEHDEVSNAIFKESIKRRQNVFANFLSNNSQTELKAYGREERATSLLEGNEQAREHLYEGCSEPSVTTKREAFIKYLQGHQNEVTQATAEGQPISLKKLLDPAGVKLFKEALEEEVNSKEYRDAVFENSAMFFEGAPWDKRPVVTVAGPSASGKTTATEHVISENQVLFGGKKESESSPNTSSHQNCVVSSDGGVVRETSQMRNLVIDFAISQGYNEIPNLQKETNSQLKSIKKHVKEAVLATKEIGLVEPITFANPLEYLSLAVKKMKGFLGLEKDNNNCALFIDVVPHDREAVKMQGEGRSKHHENTQPEPIEFSLNQWIKGGKRPEFKTYEAHNFKAGLTGSRVARTIFELLSRNGFVIQADNDLKSHPQLDHPISQQVIDRWQLFTDNFKSVEQNELIKQKLTAGIITPETLKEAQTSLASYCKLCNQLGGEEISVNDKKVTGPTRLPFALSNSAQIDIARMNKKLTNLSKNQKGELSESLQDLLGKLNEISKNGYSNFVATEPHTVAQVDALYKKVDTMLKGLSFTEKFNRRLVSSLKTLKSALDEAKKESNYREEMGQGRNELSAIIRASSASNPLQQSEGNDAVDLTSQTVKPSKASSPVDEGDLDATTQFAKLKEQFQKIKKQPQSEVEMPDASLTQSQRPLSNS